MANSLPQQKKNQNAIYALVAAFLIIVWLVAYWFMCSAWVSQSVESAFEQSKKRAKASIEHIDQGVERSLEILHFVPSLLSRNERFQNALAHLHDHQKLEAMGDKERHHFLFQSLKPVTEELNRVIHEVGTISYIWITHKDGRVAASSMMDENKSIVGLDVSFRDYYKKAIMGEVGFQYIFLPNGHKGIVFSLPLYHNNHIEGTVSALVRLSYFSQWVNTTGGFVVDRYGVILEATDPQYTFMVLPNATVHQLPKSVLEERYRRTEFETVSLREHEKDPNLKYIGNSEIPSYILVEDVEGYRLRLVTATACPEFFNTESRHRAYYIIGSIVGVLVILFFMACVYYYRALQLEREEKERSAIITKYISIDSLTQLFSRAQVEPIISQSITEAKAHQKSFAVLHMNLDLFRDINDNYGHDEGDKVLQILAHRLKRQVGSKHHLMRLGGDEFLIVSQLTNHENVFNDIAHEIQSTTQRTFHLEKTKLNLTTSIGIAVYPKDGETVTDLLKNADIALNHVKLKGRADRLFYQPEMSEGLVARQSLDEEMRRGLQNGEFKLYYQPQYSPHLKQIVGCEALIRWEHPTRGRISPGEFIPVAEYTGFIATLGDWILEEACRQSKEWRDKFKKHIQIAVNLSAIQFQRTELVDKVAEVSKKYDIQKGDLELEITETVMMADTQRTLEIINQFKALGMSISIDDFGTGYSSLSYLQQFGADVLKIDRAFIMNLEEDANSRAIVEAILNMAKNLGYKVVAEGIETQGQCDILASLQCDMIQGFWFSRPLNAADFIEFCLKHTA